MAKPGPKPKPTALKKGSGRHPGVDSGGRPLNDSEPRFRDSDLRCPYYLKGPARLEWVRLAPVLLEAGVLTEADEIALAILCHKFQRLKTAWKEQSSVNPVTYTDKGNAIQHPWVSMVNRLEGDVMKVLAEFGMSPSSRSRIELPQQGERSLADVLFEEIGDGSATRGDLESVVGVNQAEVLIDHGLDTVAKARYAQDQGIDLTEFKGIGPATVRKLGSLDED